MAITTFEQVSMWQPEGGTDNTAGDGNAMHSMLFHDLVRGINNQAARCNHGMQFAFDASRFTTTTVLGAGQTRWKRQTSVIPASGMAFLAQMPIYIPVGCSRLSTSLGISRIGLSGPDAGTIDVDVTQINYFLSPSPLPTLTTSVQFPAAPRQELVGNFLPTTLYSPKQHSVSCAGTSNTVNYNRTVDTSWSDLARGSGDGIMYLIVGVTYSNATVGESIFAEEFSCWAEFDAGNGSIALLDDNIQALCRNGAGALARVQKTLLKALIKNACRPRPIYSMWGGTDKINATGFIRQNWLNISPASPGLSARFLTMPSTQSDPDVNQGIITTVGSLDTGIAYDPQTTFANPSPFRYPTNARPSSFDTTIPEVVSSVSTKDKVYEIMVGSNTLNGPQLRSALIVEPQNLGPGQFAAQEPPAPYDNWLAPGNHIIGTELGTFKVRSIRGIRDYWRRVYKGVRPHFGWSGINDLAPYDGYSIIPGASGYRYVLKPDTVGQGAIHPASVAGQGMCIPLRYAASGRNTRVRVYVSVYARQVGGGTGTFGVYTLNDDMVSMAGPTALTNGPSVTSTTWAWYGWSSTFNPATDAYFLGNAAVLQDFVVFCGNSPTGNLHVGAFSMAVYNSSA